MREDGIIKIYDTHEGLKVSFRPSTKYIDSIKESLIFLMLIGPPPKTNKVSIIFKYIFCKYCEFLLIVLNKSNAIVKFYNSEIK